MKNVLFVICVLSLSNLFEMTRGSAVAAPSFTIGQLQKHCRSYLKLVKKTGNGKLTKAEAIDIVKCNSFIAGFHLGKTATNVLNATIGPYCLPHGDKTTTTWLIRTFLRWARKHPSYKRRTAGFGVMMSLREGNACDNRDRK